MDKQELYKEVEDLDMFCIGIRKYVALNEVMYLIKQLDEPQKVTVPQFVADWIEYCKEHNFTLLGCLDPVDELGMSLCEGFKGDTRKCVRWCRKESNTFAKAWINGYEIENEKKYSVKLKGIHPESEYLYYGIGSGTWRFRFKNESGYFRKSHTRKELEEAGFGEIFDSSLFEVDEVEE